MGRQTLHIAMYPWFAMGHLTLYLHISNKLAERGHRISFFLPLKAQQKLEAFNLHPDRIAFITIDVPHVDGLPPGAQTSGDVPFPLLSLLVTAMDLTRPTVQQALVELNPNIVFFDFAYWIPELLHQLDRGIKSIHYCIISPATIGYEMRPEREHMENLLTAADIMEPPPFFPPSSIKLRTHEARIMLAVQSMEFGPGKTFIRRLVSAFSECDAIGCKLSFV